MVVSSYLITISVFVRIPQQVLISQFFHAIKVEHFGELLGSKIQSAASIAGSLGYLATLDERILFSKTKLQKAATPK